MSRSVVEFGPVMPGDVEELAAGIRDQDRAECEAVGHTDMQHVIQNSVDVSSQAWTVRVDGGLAAIFGVAPIGTMLAPMGAPWLLGTELVPKHARILSRRVPEYISKMLEAYPHLMNQVHAKNTVSIRWLRRLGFVLRPPHQVPPHGELFHLFEMKRHV